MKKIFALLILIFVSHSHLFAQKEWHNPQKSEINPIEGQYWQGEARSNFYNRMPDRFKELVRPVLWNLSTNCAGESVRFRTNSKSITVRYALSDPKYTLAHMPNTGTNGVDLYSYSKEGVCLRVVGDYFLSDTSQYNYESINLAGAEKRGSEYQLYLPPYNGVDFLEIGVDNGSFFEFILPRKERPIVVYGTSIAQGACASRPGMIWSSIVSRNMDMPLYNFGFSGNGRLEDGLIDMICEVDAAVYVLDCMPNLTNTPFDDLAALICKQVRRIRAKHLTTPILLVDHAGYPRALTVEAYRKIESNVINAQKKAFDTLIKEGVSNLYHLDHKSLGFSYEAIVDNVHPSDYGMNLYAKAYEKMLREILSMNQGDDVTTIAVRQRREPDVYEWMDRHSVIIEQSKKGDKIGAFIGNSIFHQWGGVDGFRVQRADDVWNANFGSYINMGCGWDRIENVLWRVERGEIDYCRLDTIILKIGTNNLSVKHTDEQIIKGLDKLLTAIHKRQEGAYVFVAGVLPRRAMESRIKGLNVKIAALVDKYSYAKYGDISKGLHLDSGKLDESLFVDGLHPNRLGYQIIAQNILKSIE